MSLDVLIFISAVFGGGIASVTGFGIGSILTPALSLAVTTKLAVAMVSIPHFIATGLRFWMLRQHLSRNVFIGFGLASAAGGISGALLHARFGSPQVTLIFGCILVFAGIMGTTGISEKLRFHGAGSWIAGSVSGFLGGLVGNQGGIRSAALLGFDLSRLAFVSTATAAGLVVDISRIPVYLYFQGAEIFENRWLVFVMCGGVILGTLLGTRILRGINERVFRRTVSAIILVLGIFMISRGL